MDIRLIYHSDLSYISTENKLVIVNHSSFLDIFILIANHIILFPEHQLIWVAKSECRDIPCIGKYMEKNHILLSRNNFEKDTNYIREFMDRFEKEQQPFIVYCFVEGTIRCPQTMKKSYLQHPTHKWQNLLYPKIGALSMIVPCVKEVLDVTLVYEGVARGQYENDLNIGRYPHTVSIYTKNVSSLFSNISEVEDYKKSLFTIWDKKDQFLQEHRYSLARYRPEYSIRFKPSFYVILMIILFLFYLLCQSKGLVFCMFVLLYLIVSIEKLCWKRHNTLDNILTTAISYHCLLYNSFIPGTIFALLSIVISLCYVVFIDILGWVDTDSVMIEWSEVYRHLTCTLAILMGI